MREPRLQSRSSNTGNNNDNIIIIRKGSHHGKLPYWQVNVPPEEHTADCPDFLRGISAKDISILSLSDTEFVDGGLAPSWDAVRWLVATGRVGDFGRLPSQLRLYRAFTYRMRGDTGGGIAAYILKWRLRWRQPVVPRGSAPLQHPDDFKILFNDWPYAVDPDVVHVVVWSKFMLDEDPVTTELTPRGYKLVEDFVRRTFRSRMPEDHVIWFKNTAAFKSVHAVEHFHVMLYRPDPSFLIEITNGDMPLARQLPTGMEEVKGRMMEM